MLVDCGAGIGDNVLFFAGAAQEALLVISAEPTSLTDAYAAVKVLSQQAGLDRFSVVVNQVPTEAHGREVFGMLSRVTDCFLTARVSFLGHVPRDENLQRALMAQRPVVDLFPRSPSSRALQDLSRELLDGRRRPRSRRPQVPLGSAPARGRERRRRAGQRRAGGVGQQGGFG